MVTMLVNTDLMACYLSKILIRVDYDSCIEIDA